MIVTLALLLAISYANGLVELNTKLGVTIGDTLLGDCKFECSSSLMILYDVMLFGF